MTTEQSLRADWIAIGVGAVALALILGALGYQYLGGLPPCQMCHWQRWPHIAAAVIGLYVPGIQLTDVGCTSKTLPELPELWAGLVARR